MYVHVWNDSGTIESSAELDFLKAPDKDSTRLDCLDHSVELECFETQIKIWQGLTVLGPEFIESIDKGDNEDLVW